MIIAGLIGLAVFGLVFHLLSGVVRLIFKLGFFFFFPIIALVWVFGVAIKAAVIVGGLVLLIGLAKTALPS